MDIYNESLAAAKAIASFVRELHSELIISSVFDP
jgi:hypothetical protein